jgi:hypothetical protein
VCGGLRKLLAVLPDAGSEEGAESVEPGEVVESESCLADAKLFPQPINGVTQLGISSGGR